MPDIHGLEPDDLTGIAAPVNKNDQIRRLQAAVQRLKPRPGDPKTPALTIGCLCAAMRVAIRTLRQPNHVGWEDTLANHLQDTLASEGLAKSVSRSEVKYLGIKTLRETVQVLRTDVSDGAVDLGAELRGAYRACAHVGGVSKELQRRLDAILALPRMERPCGDGGAYSAEEDDRGEFVLWEDVQKLAKGECQHEFEGRAADGGCISMSQPVHFFCSKCGKPEED